MIHGTCLNSGLLEDLGVKSVPGNTSIVGKEGSIDV